MGRRVALVNEIPYEKVYYACLLLGLRNSHANHVDWVNIDQLYQFLVNNQRLCEKSDGKHGMDWALWPSDMYPLGWDEDFFVNILATLYQQGMLANDRRSDGNYFRCRHPDKHGLYQLRNTAKYDEIVEKKRRGEKVS